MVSLGRKPQETRTPKIDKPQSSDRNHPTTEHQDCFQSPTEVDLAAGPRSRLR